MTEDDVLGGILAADPRYERAAYEFVQHGLRHTLIRLDRKPPEEGTPERSHVTAAQLLEGIREFAVQQYGPLVRTVLAEWGVTKTGDFGNIVFNLVEADAMGKTDEDQLSDFEAVYDFEAAFPAEAGTVEIVRDTDDD
jgi:uncharacterized repeat protein (TIGR04138 family)